MSLDDNNLGDIKDLDDTKMKESDFARVLFEYFTTHAKQRMQMFNFYIILETIFITAFCTLCEFGDKVCIYRIVVSLAIIVFSVAFGFIDKRSKMMIKESEKALRNLEGRYEDKYGKDIMIFTNEEESTVRQRENCCLGSGLLSYSKMLKFIYSFFIIIGGVCFLIELAQICACKCC